MADGDLRAAMNGLEAVAISAQGRGSARIELEDVAAVFEKRSFRYDKSGDEHYNLISAFHKSLRGSDPDGAIYWLFRMLESGEDPMYVARRMAAVATEDVGMADPGALSMTMSAIEAYRFLGAAEGERALAQAAIYLATAPKSNAVYRAQSAVTEVIRKTGNLPVPIHLRNAPTSLMAEMGYKKGYRYAHDYPGAFAPQQYLPDAIDGSRWYHPTDRGFENTVARRIAHWDGIRAREKKE